MQLFEGGFPALSNMDLATFQDFELDLELNRHGQGCQRRQLCFLLLCGRVQSNHDDKEMLYVLYLLVLPH